MSWLSPIVSLANPENMQSLDVAFVPLPTHVGDDMENFLKRLDDSPILAQLDDILQEARFNRIKPFYVRISMINSSKAVNDHIFGARQLASQGEWSRWDELVRRKMPLSNRRGTLRYAVERSSRNVSPCI